jgi:hypothetical protein
MGCELSHSGAPVIRDKPHVIHAAHAAQRPSQAPGRSSYTRLGKNKMLVGKVVTSQDKQNVVVGRESEHCRGRRRSPPEICTLRKTTLSLAEKNYAEPRLRVRRLTNMPPRLKPSSAPSRVAVSMVLGKAPPVPRDKSTELYAMAKVQKVSRKYIRVIFWENCVTNALARPSEYSWGRRSRGDHKPAALFAQSWVMYTGQVPGGSTYVFKTPISGGAPVKFSDRAGGVASISLDGRHLSMGSQDKNGTTVGVTVSTLTGAQEGVDTQLGDSFDHGARWMPDGRSVATVDIRSGTLNLWSGLTGTC